MCGILALFGNNESSDLNERREHFLKLSKLIRHRGPDWNGIYLNPFAHRAILAQKLAPRALRGARE